MSTPSHRLPLATSVILTVVIAAAVGALFAPAAGAAEMTLPSGFRDTTVWSSLEEPTNVRFAPDGEVFVAEKSGTILVFESLQDKTPEVFAELSKPVFDKGDRGLLGLAVDPEFPAKPYVYALYTFNHVIGEEPPGAFPRWVNSESTKGDPCPLPEGADVDDCPVSGRLVRLTAQITEHEGRPVADRALEEGGEAKQKVLLEDWCQQDSTHSIGDLQFGPEGALYVSGGDGAGYVSPDYGQIGWPHPNMCADPPTGFGVAPEPPTAEGGSLRSQDVLTPENPLIHADPTSLDGSLLRINPGTGEGWPTNPLSSSPDPNARRIIATGFRNPFRFSLDPSGEHAYVDNVGSSEYEEIDQVGTNSAQLYNSGWPCYEGPEHQFLWRTLHLNVCEELYAHPGLVNAPLFDYSHDSEVVPGDQCPHVAGSAITGNAVYPGGSFPAEYDGALFFSDSVRGCLWVMLKGPEGTPDPSTTQLFASGEQGLYEGVDLEPGPEGSLYYVQLIQGSIHRISYDPGAPTARLKANRISGQTPLEVTFDAGESTDPEHETLSYEWDFGTGTFSPGPAQLTHTFTNAENYDVRVRVKDQDPKSADSVAQVTIYPGDEPPAVDILEPTESLHWHVGQTIHFSGSAEDAEGNPLRYTHLYWDARILHCPTTASECHRHPLQTFPAVESGDFVAPEHDYPSGIELILTATDSRGLAGSASVLLPAIPVELQLRSVPPGVPLTAGEVAGPAPFSEAVIQDSHLLLVAPETYDSAGVHYTFKSWSDGGAPTHTIEASQSSEFVAEYSVSPQREGTNGPPPAVPPPLPTPNVRLGSHPPKKARSTTARFAFSATVTGSSYWCRLDRAPYRSCLSPKVYRRLKPGAHQFKVIAIGPNGGAPSSPARFRWTVLRPRR